MFLSGTLFPIAFMPEYLQTFRPRASLYYIVEGLNNVMVYQNYMAAVIDMR